MGKCSTFYVAIVALLGYGAFKTWNCLTQVPDVPQMENTWWGAGDPNKEDTSIKPFKINVPEEVLKDLKHRLDIARPFQTPLENVNHEYGLNTKLLSKIVDYWKTNYNWREREKFLNQYPQYTISVQGLRIHYIHIKPKNAGGKKVIPMLLIHGWPGSVREFYEAIPTLIEPQKDFVFELIIPSLPGYGFSEAAVRPGLGAVQVAVMFGNFMKRLGFEKYYIQGGDWGAVIVQTMSILYPDNVIGVHSNMCSVTTKLTNVLTFVGSFWPSLVATEKEIPYVYPWSEKFFNILLESGYMHLQATKPDTIGTALRESPVALGAYILEKFITWTNPAYRQRLDGGLLDKYTYDKLLDNVMIYWVSDSITTSMRLYSETLNKNFQKYGFDEIPITIPSGCARFTYELMFTPEKFLRIKYPKLIHLTDYEGGHFAAFEKPVAVAKDIIEFVKKTETLPKTEKKEL